MPDHGSTLDLLEELRVVLGDLERMLAGRVVDIEMARVQVVADPALFRREFAALVESVLATAESSRPITVRVARTGRAARIEVFEDHDDLRVERGITSMTVPLAAGPSHAADG